MAKVRTTVSLDEEIINGIDEQAGEWYSDRSNTIKRVFLEWKQLRTEQKNPEPLKEVKINGITYTQIELAEAA